MKTPLDPGIAAVAKALLSELSKGAVEELKSFTQKRGIIIDPINMFWIHRQKDQTSSSKCGILHKYVYGILKYYMEMLAQNMIALKTIKTHFNT